VVGGEELEEDEFINMLALALNDDMGGGGWRWWWWLELE
jgi:hypothetical protein